MSPRAWPDTKYSVSIYSPAEIVPQDFGLSLSSVLLIMKGLSKEDIDELLESWDENRTKMREAEKKVNKYKAVFAKLMDEENTNVISGKHYKLTRRHTTRTSISKDRVPKELWDKYSTRSSFPVFTLN